VDEQVIRAIDGTDDDKIRRRGGGKFTVGIDRREGRLGDVVVE